MTELERLAAGCLAPGFVGLTPPDWIREWVERGLGGVVLFARNIAGPQQLAELTAALRAGRSDLFVAVDEEGGDVTRLEAAEGSSYPGNWALGVVDDVSLTERVAVAIGGELALVGVDLDLAPVADVNTNPDNPVIGIRSFGADSALVARHVAAFVTGLQASGVGACAKHFPGHGDTELDSHLQLPSVHADRETLLARELEPFRAAIGARVRAVMTAHVVVPAIDAEPATVSRAVVHGLLREELGFDGLVITDALEMGAVRDTVGVEESAVRALAAGADALCLGAELEAEAVAGCVAAIVAAVGSGRLAEERLREAAARVSAAAAAPSAHAAPDRAVGLEAARRALRVEGDVEVTAAPLVVELRPPPSIAAGPARHGLGELLAPRRPGTDTIVLTGPSPDPDAVLADPARPLVVVLRDAHRHPWERETAEALLARAGGGVVVETGIPRWSPSVASGYVATHGGGRVNLEAAAELLAPT